MIASDDDPDSPPKKPETGPKPTQEPQPNSRANGQQNSAAQAEVRRLQILRDGALQPGPARDRIYLSHPLVCDSMYVITKAIQEAYNGIEQAIVHRDPGLCLIGDFRKGKSRAIDVIMAELAKTFADIPVGLVNAKFHDSPTERQFYTDLLTNFNHPGALYGTAAERRSRILALIEAAARATSSDRYLLFVDEGQNWHASEFTYLRDITNDMRYRSVVVISIIFAHTELLNTRQQLIQKRRTDLVGRFLLNPREFRGIRDVDELRYYLRAYDDPTQSEYPPGTGISTSEFFLGGAFKAGWRFEAEATGMWAAYETIAGRTGRKPQNIGMQWVTPPVRNFLFSNYSADSPLFCCDENAWVRAIEASQYESSLT